MTNTIAIITPPNSYKNPDDIGWGLVSLTKLLHETDKQKAVEGFLGGEFGYGTDFENSIFMIHHYCWCERDTCQWCNEDACGCHHPNPEAFLDGKPIDDWWAANEAIVSPLPWEIAKQGTKQYKLAQKAFDDSIKERDSRLMKVWPERLHTCEPRGMMADRPRGDTWLPPQSAPNFWHKPSNSRVWWYKWIGRDMKVYLNAPCSEIMRDCYASVAPVGYKP